MRFREGLITPKGNKITQFIAQQQNSLYHQKENNNKLMVWHGKLPQRTNRSKANVKKSLC